ncbi:hypothetical protein ES332_A01G137800v1 [Gossypium tomentosum]|uniref:Uncharacterized protein n=1 Tax=Gossypium tomentosum TaxID=34277 RepID=A0A5D2RQA8_GOSTO|nr:hypothetical protein ES332_A01G137800v1 [Gossypium tomentosum]
MATRKGHLCPQISLSNSNPNLIIILFYSVFQTSISFHNFRGFEKPLFPRLLSLHFFLLLCVGALGSCGSFYFPLTPIKKIMIRKTCPIPNLHIQDGLETVLEVPILEEMCTQLGTDAALLPWLNMRALMNDNLSSTPHLQAKSDTEFLALLKIVGAPLIPFQVHLLNYTLSSPLRHCPFESSSAKYIVQQSVAASGGHLALGSATSMCAMGRVKMKGSEMQAGYDSVQLRRNCEVGIGTHPLFEKSKRVGTESRK